MRLNYIWKRPQKWVGGIVMGWSLDFGVCVGGYVCHSEKVRGQPSWEGLVARDKYWMKILTAFAISKLRN